MGEIFPINYYSIKEGANRKNYGSTVIPKAQGVQKSFFSCQETKDRGACLLHVAWAIREHFFSRFCLRPCHRNNMEENSYSAMDSPVYGEDDNVISVEDWICMLWLFILSTYKLFPVWSMYKSIFLLSPLCRAVTSKVLGFQSWNFGGPFL